MPIEGAVRYNEIDAHAAQWLRNLIALGELPDGVVDERSIVDLRGDDLAGCDEAHFFAGIGVWARAVAEAEEATGHRLARPLFTGSCPCQPLSVAGQRQGHVDERHVWPAFHRLIAERRPATILGEQVAGKDGLEWMAAVRHDLEASGYAVGTAVLPACGVGAPHIRYRMFFVADAQRGGRQQFECDGPAGLFGAAAGQLFEPCNDCAGAGGVADAERCRDRRDARALRGAQRTAEGAQPKSGREAEETLDDRPPGGLADAEHAERRALDINREDGRDGKDGGRAQTHGELGACGEVRGLADASRQRRQQVGRGASGDEETDGRARWDGGEPDSDHVLAGDSAARWPRPPDGFWSDADWIFCRDNKWRPIEPGSFPLVDGSAFRLGSGGPYEGKSRAGMLRGYGNAVVLPVARAFVECALEAIHGH